MTNAELQLIKDQAAKHIQRTEDLTREMTELYLLNHRSTDLTAVPKMEIDKYIAECYPETYAWYYANSHTKNVLEDILTAAAALAENSIPA